MENQTEADSPEPFETTFPREGGFMARYYQGDVKVPLGGHIIFEVSMGSPSENLKIGRNDPCECGSGVKYKKCCGKLARS